MLTRSVQGSSGRISVVNGNAVAGNPTIDLIDTSIALETEWTNAAGQFNIPSLISVGGDNLPEAANRTVNSTRYTVDQYGRFTSALTIPIATAREGSKYPLTLVLPHIIDTTSLKRRKCLSSHCGHCCWWWCSYSYQWRFWKLALPRELRQRSRRD